MAGSSLTPWVTQPNAPPTSLFGNPSTFTAAANTQGSDYDKIMSQYEQLAKSASTNPITAAPITSSPVQFRSIAPQLSDYKQSSDVTGSLSNLSNLATTGGYSDSDIANIRERDISPIRSIYANAQQNVERQKALSGGYSPNFNAVQAKMARDESAQIGDATTSANAGIAQNIASNRLAASPSYASSSSSANSAQTAADRANADIINQINQLNQQEDLQTQQLNSQNTQNTEQFNTQAKLAADQANRTTTQGALQGKTSLYGTTPALTNTFGNQVVQASQLGQNQQNLNNQKFNTIGRLSGFGAG